MVAVQTIESHLFYDPVGTRVPVAISFSIAVHIFGMALALWLTEKTYKAKTTVISDVELLLDRASPRRAARRKAAPSMKDFLKMALPARRPRIRSLEVKAPDRMRKPIEVPKLKLKDRGKMDMQPKMKIDMGKRRVAMAKINQPLTERKARTLAALPKLEEVGSRRAAPKVLAAAALAEERSDRLRAMGMDAQFNTGRRAAPKAAPLLAAAPGGLRPRSALDRLKGVLPESTRITEAARPMPVRKKLVIEPEAEAIQPLIKKPVILEGVKKKAVEIEGPLSNRKVTAYSIPEFPEWAKDLGMVEADVAIKFYVDPDGDVIADRMRVERTSGYGRLDRLAMQHLRDWRFEPRPMTERVEWGIITFRFLLE